jgi:septal ring factor EnvC (AmiA/AmiB activator)
MKALDQILDIESRIRHLTAELAQHYEEIEYVKKEIAELEDEKVAIEEELQEQYTEDLDEEKRLSKWAHGKEDW